MKTAPKLGLAAVGIAAVTGWLLWPPANMPRDPEQSAVGAALVDVILPASFTETERNGQTAFNANCATCHGRNGAGRDGAGPPLVHVIYEPGHHGDQAFHLAAMNGVRAHHWSFGDMPPVEGISMTDLDFIVAYIRALQRTNGIN